MTMMNSKHARLSPISIFLLTVSTFHPNARTLSTASCNSGYSDSSSRSLNIIFRRQLSCWLSANLRIISHAHCSFEKLSSPSGDSKRTSDERVSNMAFFNATSSSGCLGLRSTGFSLSPISQLISVCRKNKSPIVKFSISHFELFARLHIASPRSSLFCSSASRPYTCQR